MDFLVKRRRGILILIALIAVYFILRLPNLTLQPIFADEAIYIRWAQVMRAESTLRFLPLSDGKTPLFMWAMIPLFKFIHDPLLAGRVLSVISGFFTLLGVFFLSRKIYNTRTAFWASLLYVITPYTVFFDRMALVDSMLAAFTVWSVYFAVWLVSSLRLDIAMILGYLLGGGILTKTPGMFNLLVLPITIIGFIRRKGGKNALIKLIALWGVAIGIALAMYNMLRLGPNFQMLSSRNMDYIFSPMELIGRPLDPFIPHFNDIADWFPKLLTWPILFCVVMGMIYIIYMIWQQMFRGPSLLGGIILLWALIPLLLNMAFLRTFTARYLFPSIPLFLVIAGFGATKILPRLAYIRRFPILLMLIVLLPLPLYFDFFLLTSPGKVPLPKEERKGYFEDWTSGYGFSDIAKFLLEKSRDKKVVLGTAGSFGTLPDGIQIYLDKSKISIVTSSATISAQVRNAAKDNLTYFIGNKRDLEGSASDIVLIKEYPKLKPLDNSLQDATVLYQVLP
ncbi:MAG: glycosyltransferase family 39 protein [Candidatus Daviesbacteria bacterium]|nr:glycosyltransferase family 39 protein [Candidatus Daviesbacteria bacterium]